MTAVNTGEPSQVPTTGLGKIAAGPVTVFHHVPKCGGTSLLAVLQRWYTVCRDYRQGWAQEFGPPLDLTALDGRHCLCGHFDGPENRLAVRYPEIFQSPRFRCVTVVRDPLSLVLSLYRWEGRMGVRREDVLDRYLMGHVGFLADALGAGPDNWRAVLDRYIFIGLQERLEETVTLLAHRLGKPRVALPRLNVTDPRGRAPHRRRLSAETVARFRAANRLDEAIYTACLRRFALETRPPVDYSECSFKKPEMRMKAQ
ncbi:MAG: hypothetical protein PHV70_11225 [Desulfobacteraceae bacterium]|nr:hypothetical protein [Desulfobacteraceae bacterium]